jgi:hypothetical protein
MAWDFHGKAILITGATGFLHQGAGLLRDGIRTPKLRPS